MISKLEKIEEKFIEIERQLNNPEVFNNPKKIRELSRQRSSLSDIINKIKEYKEILHSIDEDKKIINESKDADLVDLAKEEIDELFEQKDTLEKEIKVLLLPKDPNDDKNIILEVRAGTGGEEAALFAGELFRMYQRYAEKKNWKIEIMDANPTELGGFKEVLMSVSGDRVFSRLKFESGVHRVQRVPDTESSGRLHTSAASVAVLPEAEDIDIDINPDDLRIDVYRSTGHGGQSVNTTDSAVRITHVPTGIVVQCQDEKSQIKNKAKALKVLRARLLDKYQREQKEFIASERKTMVGSGDRSAKIRTYNYPQKRITDHRINLSLYRLDEMLNGDLDEMIDGLIIADQTERLKLME